MATTSSDLMTDIVVLLDRSGSMASMRDDAIGGFNALLKEQKALPGGARLTLIQFDNEYEVNYVAKPIAECADLTHETFVPRGGTLLRTAFVRAVKDAKARLAEELVPVVGSTDLVKPERLVVFVVITDGEDTGSAESGADVRKLTVEEKEWKFLFLGTNIDAVAGGQELGIKGMAYSKKHGGVANAIRGTSAYVGSMRMARSAAASPVMRAAAIQNEALFDSSCNLDDGASQEAMASFKSMVDDVTGAPAPSLSEELLLKIIGTTAADKP